MESLDEATWRTGSSRVCPELLDAQQIHGEQNSAEGQAVQEKCPPCPDLCDDQTGHSRADHLADEERG